MKTYAIWKDKEVVDYIKLTEEQVMQLNDIKGIGVYFDLIQKLIQKNISIVTNVMVQDIFYLHMTK